MGKSKFCNMAKLFGVGASLTHSMAKENICSQDDLFKKMHAC